MSKWAWVCCLTLISVAGCGGNRPDDIDMGSDSGVTMDQAPACTEQADCDDGLFCNGLEQCTDSRCVAGEAVACDDGIACTVDRCSEDTRACRSDAPDLDGDGHRDASCLDGAGAPLGDDCDDDDINRFPSNIEVCDTANHDEDCDEATFGRIDRDNDTFADARCCNSTAAGGMNCGTDCNDVRPEIRPGSTEACDRLDNDCDGTVDELVALTGFVDADFDGIGGSIPMNSCGGVAGFSTQGGDCDDGDASIFPGAPELCDGVNNDCDSGIDETMDSADWYPDVDGDGFGDMNAAPISSCFIQVDHSLRGTDCNDNAAAINPAAAELCDGLDNNCNGRADFEIGVNDFEDDDGDGVVDLACPIFGADCDDEDPATGGGAAEACDGRDNDCDERIDEDADSRQWFRDNDRDGYGSVVSGSIISCQPTAGFIAQAGDCDDNRMDRFPNAQERCNGTDDDCDGAVDEGPASGSCAVAPDTQSMRCVSGECRVQTCLPGRLDCDGSAVNGCEVAESVNSCGQCGQSCMRPGVMTASCTTGQCAIITCQPGRGNCDGDPSNGCETDVTSSDANCGACAMNGGAICGAAMGGQTRCVGGLCQVSLCAPNRGDCNGMPMDGCETTLDVSTDHCGACFRYCGVDSGRHISGGSCFQGVCSRTCDFLWGDCNNNQVDGCERSLSDDMQNCGECGRQCVAPNNAQNATCSSGFCSWMCRPGFGDCNLNPSDGCEVDFSNDLQNCGGCAGAGGQMCQPGSGGELATCEQGFCRLQCAPGTASCDGDAMNGCETNTRTDVNHCGGCGFPCPGGPSGTPVCQASQCGLVCNPGFADCDPSPGCETFVGSDTLNCGGCGVTCGAGSSCAAGFCDRGLELAVGNDYACMARENDAVVCWGNNDNFRLGFNGVVPPVTPPGPPPPGFLTLGLREITVGSGHSCGLDGFGTVQCWGRNDRDQLGVPGADSASPVVLFPPAGAVSIAAGAEHTCVLGADAQVYCWGSDQSGQLGNTSVSTTSASPVPVEVAGATPLTDVVAIASGTSASCAATVSSGIYCWGSLSMFNSATALQVAGSASWTDVQELAMGREFACARRSAFGGSIYCWGDNTYGQIATPVSAGFSSPARLSGISGPQELYAGDDLLCARTSSGVFCRGRNDFGQRLGTANPMNPLDRFAAVAASGEIVEFARAGGGAGPICGWTAKRDVYCWGDNPFGFIAPMGGSFINFPTRIQNLTRTEP
ncbi:MAG: hypothetical protein KC593_20090 [Myxococcales bacterium]|nr:hypothetical protein [Myxococcales bacterium]